GCMAQKRSHPPAARRLMGPDENASGWKIVCDNLNTHVSEGVVRLVAQLCGVNEELGEKSEGQGLAGGLLARSGTPYLLPLYSETCFVAQPDRNLVFHPGPQAPAPGQFQ